MPTNTIKTADIARVADIEFVEQFTGGIRNLLTMLGIYEPQVMPAGSQVKTYTVSGQLAAQPAAEGDEIPLSKYTQTAVNTYTMTLNEYRKQTSALAIIQHGYDAAVAKTDRKMLSQIRAAVKSQLFSGLDVTGVTTATGTGFQSAVANAIGKLINVASTDGDEVTPIVFANPLDVYAYIGDAPITIQTAFGLNYLENFVGARVVVMDALITQNTLFVTDAANLNAYYVDFAALAEAGLNFTTDETGLIGVHHTGRYENGTSETYVDTGLVIFPERADYIVKSTIAATVDDGN